MGLLNYMILGFMALTGPFATFRSESLEGLTFKTGAATYQILDDNQDSIQVSALVDQYGARYWYRYVDTEVCLTGECNRIEAGIFWDLTGEFKGLEIYREPLTKSDHSVFTTLDYLKLISVLENDWSVLKEYSMEDLMDHPDNKVDGTSGATKKEISAEAVENAVYTTFTLWHLIHEGEKAQLAVLASDLLRDPLIRKELIATKSEKYHQLVLDQYVLGNIPTSRDVKDLIVSALYDPNKISLFSTALGALAKTDLSDTLFQQQLGRRYGSADVKQKVAILSAMEGEYKLHPELYHAVAKSLDTQDEWLVVKILSILVHADTHTTYVLRRLEEMQSTSNQELLKVIVK